MWMSHNLAHRTVHWLSFQEFYMGKSSFRWLLYKTYSNLDNFNVNGIGLFLADNGKILVYKWGNFLRLWPHILIQMKSK